MKKIILCVVLGLLFLGINSYAKTADRVANNQYEKVKCFRDGFVLVSKTIKKDNSSTEKVFNFLKTKKTENKFLSKEWFKLGIIQRDDGFAGNRCILIGEKGRYNFLFNNGKLFSHQWSEDAGDITPLGETQKFFMRYFKTPKGYVFLNRNGKRINDKYYHQGVYQDEVKGKDGYFEFVGRNFVYVKKDGKVFKLYENGKSELDPNGEKDFKLASTFNYGYPIGPTDQELKVEQIIDKMTRRLNPGGKNLNNIKTILVKSDSIWTMKASPATRVGKAVLKIKRPDKFVYEIFNNKGKLKQKWGFDGKHSWRCFGRDLQNNPIVVIDDSKHALTNAQFQYALNNPIKNAEFYKKYLDGGDLGKTKVKVGKYNCYKLDFYPNPKYLNSDNRVEFLYYIDDIQYLPREIKIGTVGGITDTIYEEYDTVNGIRFPKKKKMELNKNSSIIQSNTELTCNIKLNNSEFEIPVTKPGMIWSRSDFAYPEHIFQGFNCALLNTKKGYNFLLPSGKLFSEKWSKNAGIIMAVVKNSPFLMCYFKTDKGYIFLDSNGKRINDQYYQQACYQDGKDFVYVQRNNKVFKLYADGKLKADPNGEKNYKEALADDINNTIIS